MTEMNEAQARTYQRINDSWPVEKHTVEDDGTVLVECEDGDRALIEADGSWDWLA